MGLLRPLPPKSETERRARLRTLDSLLDRLEWVNERGLEELPDTLVASLRAEGIACTALSSPTEMIQLVWDHQEPYLHTPPQTRRRRTTLDLRHELFLTKLHRAWPRN